MADSAGRKKLGQILIEQGVLSAENLKKALEIQKHDAGLLGEILVRQKMVKEEDIVIALATQFHYPYLAVKSFVINPEAVRAVPSELAVQYTFIPIDKHNTILTLVMADPSDEQILRKIETATSCQVQAFVGTVSEIEHAIKVNYKVSPGDKGKNEGQKVKMIFKSSSPTDSTRKEI